jgi:hypothetical protein
LLAAVALLASLAPALADSPPQLLLVEAGMAGSHAFQMTFDLGTQDVLASVPTLAVTVRFGPYPVHVEFPVARGLTRVPVVLDLSEGDALVGRVRVAHFSPVPRFTENLRASVAATLGAEGTPLAGARGWATILLPTVIVPGYLNEVGGPDEDALGTLRRRGYATRGPYPTLFWFSYPSRRVTLPDGARRLRTFVKERVLPATYAGAINAVGYSSGGLFLRWNIQHDLDGWGSLVTRLVLVGVPNEGAVIAYLGAHTPALFALGGLGHTSLARAMFPTFPFWRPGPHAPWQTPADAANPLLDELNVLPLPDRVRVYVFYGSHDPGNPAGPLTIAGITGSPTTGELTYGPGDGIVLADSARGLPVHGSAGVPGLTRRVVESVDLGSVYHLHLLAAGAERIADVLLDKFEEP